MCPFLRWRSDLKHLQDLVLLGLLHDLVVLELLHDFLDLGLVPLLLDFEIGASIRDDSLLEKSSDALRRCSC